jgi:hypothetical protein
VTPPFTGDWKALVSYPVKGGINVSATWQNRQGPQILARENSALTLNTQYGPSWLTPLGITQGRLVKFGVQIDY